MRPSASTCLASQAVCTRAWIMRQRAASAPAPMASAISATWSAVQKWKMGESTSLGVCGGGETQSPKDQSVLSQSLARAVRCSTQRIMCGRFSSMMRVSP